MCDHYGCPHSELTYCPDCSKVFCKRCGKVWFDWSYTPPPTTIPYIPPFVQPYTTGDIPPGTSLFGLKVVGMDGDGQIRMFD